MAILGNLEPVSFPATPIYDFNNNMSASIWNRGISFRKTNLKSARETNKAEYTVSVREQTQTKIFDFAGHLNRRVSVNKIRARFYQNILSLLLKKDPSTNVKNELI